jgi:hypothetical protein
MKTHKEVKSKLKQALFRYYKKELKQSLSRTCTSCVHNKPITLEGFTPVLTRFCSNEQRLGWVCDPALGDLSDMCPFFQTEDVDSLKDRLRVKMDTLESLPLSKLAAAYPDAAALKWVLGDSEEAPILEPDQTSEAPTEPLDKATGQVLEATPIEIPQVVVPMEIQQETPALYMTPLPQNIKVSNPFQVLYVMLASKIGLLSFYLTRLFGI